MMTAYTLQRRDNNEGTCNLHDSLELREEYYSLSFLLQLKRKEIFKDGYDSDGDNQ